MEISGKVAIVTGASQGIGLAAARRLAQAGARVILAARSMDLLEQLERELKDQGAQAVAIQTDMRRKEDIDQMAAVAVARFGQIDILVNNAGQSIAGRIENLDLEGMQQIIDLNIYGPIYAMQAVIPVMRQHGGGIIVNISSRTSKMNIPGLAGYASTKAALNLISQTARAELAPDNIRVITFYPRVTATNFGKNALGDQAMRQRQRSGMNPEIVVDSAEAVADKIAEAIEKEPAEQYMDDNS